MSDEAHSSKTRAAQLRSPTGPPRLGPSKNELATKAACPLSPSPCRNKTGFLPQPVRLYPQSQSFSRSYGSNLPTSLTYIVLGLEAVHLGDLLRIWVRTAMKIILPPSDFQGPTKAFPTPQEPWCFTGPASLSPDKQIPGTEDFTKKRELFREPSPTSLSSVALPRWIPKDLSPWQGQEY